MVDEEYVIGQLGDYRAHLDGYLSATGAVATEVQSGGEIVDLDFGEGVIGEQHRASGRRWLSYSVLAAAAVVLLVVATTLFDRPEQGLEVDFLDAPSETNVPETIDEDVPAPVDGVVSDPVEGSPAFVWSRVDDDEAVFGGEGGQSMLSVTSGGPGLVAVGYGLAGGEDADAAVWTSADGAVWSRVVHDEAVFGGVGGQSMNSVTAGGPGLVAVGSDDGGRDAAVWTSVDGVVWSRVAHDEMVFGGDGDPGMWSVTAGGPGLVAVGSAGFWGEVAVWTSVDGMVWSRVAHDETGFGGEGRYWVGSVASGGPGLVAVGWADAEGDGGEDAAVWTSVDGLVWSRVAHDEAIFGGDGGQSMKSVIVGGPGLVAVGSDGDGEDALVWTSVDGFTWSRVSDDGGAFTGQSMASVTVGGPGLVAVGWSPSHGENEDAAVWTSPDGIVWSRVAHDELVFGGDSAQWMGSVTSVGPVVVAVGWFQAGNAEDAAAWTLAGVVE